MYSISYLYFGAIATSLVVLVGLIVSYATGKTVKRLDTRKLPMHDDAALLRCSVLKANKLH